MAASESAPLFGGGGAAQGAASRRSRGPTDFSFVWLVLGPIFTAMFLVAASATYSGNLKRLIHGTDFAGNICGVDAAVRSRPYQYWPFELPDGDTVRGAGCRGARSALQPALRVTAFPALPRRRR